MIAAAGEMSQSAAALWAAVLTAVVALLTLALQAEQARRTRRKEDWWRRVEWALAGVFDADPVKRAVSLHALTVLSGESAAGPDEQTFLNSVARATEQQARQGNAARSDLVTVAAGDLSNRAQVFKVGGTAVLTRSYRRAGWFSKSVSAGTTVQILMVRKRWWGGVALDVRLKDGTEHRAVPYEYFRA